MHLSQFQQVLTTHPGLLVYFYGADCGVCTVLWPQVEHLVRQDFPKLELVRVQASESRDLAGQLRMLSVPGILLYIDGQECFRANGMIALHELRQRIARPYHLFFDLSE